MWRSERFSQSDRETTPTIFDLAVPEAVTKTQGEESKADEAAMESEGDLTMGSETNGIRRDLAERRRADCSEGRLL